MRRKIAVLSLAGLLAALLFAPDAEAGCKRGRKGGGKYVTYDGASFGSYPRTYAPQPLPTRRQPMMYRPQGPSYMPYAPAAPGGGFPAPPPPMMGS